MTREEAIQYIDGLRCEEDFPYTEDTIAYFIKERNEAIDMAIEALSVANLKEEFESADATPTVIKAKTFMGKEDFDKWAENIKKQNKSIVCIPCDAEVVSADAVVRCKDCRYYWENLGEDDTDEMYGECRWDSDEMPNADDFCSYGERKE